MMDRKPDNDKLEPVSEELLEEYLAGGTRLSEEYHDSGQPEPPAALDRAILDEAREEVKPPLIDTGNLSFWRHWMRPVTVVLTMGVCVAVVLEVMNTASPPLPGLSESEVILADEGLQGKTQFDVFYAPQAASPPEAAPAQTDRPATMTAQRSEQPERKSNQALRKEELLVSARKRDESLQDVPLAMTAFSVSDPDGRMQKNTGRLEEIVIDADESFAADALEAWEAGTQPSVKVWLAGIQAMIDGDDTEFASQELERMARVHPNEAAQFREDQQLPLDTGMGGAGIVRAEEFAVVDGVAEEPDPTDNIVDASVWLAGIDWLYDTGADEEAAVETEKFRRIYPNF
jgi:hypothetical protein